MVEAFSFLFISNLFCIFISIIMLPKKFSFFLIIIFHDDIAIIIAHDSDNLVVVMRSMSTS